MKEKIIVFLFVLSVLFISSVYKTNKTKIIASIEDNVHIDDEVKTKEVTVIYNNENSTLNMEEYVVGVVACEMPASFNIEALKALSVAARTYARYKIARNSEYVLKSDTSDQCYIGQEEMNKKWGNNFNKYYTKIYEAVSSTNNEIMVYNNEIIIPFYFAISNGYTENSENVFSQKLDYLVSVDSNWDNSYNYKEENKVFTVHEFENLIGISNIKSSDIIIERNITNRVAKIIIKGKEYKGTEFRKLLSLRSTDFSIKIGDNVEIHTKGYGHGVGMSEYGANTMASIGYTYDEILKYYYTGIKIVNNY